MSDSRSPYSDETEVARDPYGPEDTSDLKTAVKNDPNYKYYWERESLINLRIAEGYEVVGTDSYDGNLSIYARKSQDHVNSTSCYRLPTQDSDEDLILLRMPMEMFVKKEQKRLARADEVDRQLHPKRWGTEGTSWSQESSMKVTK